MHRLYKLGLLVFIACAGVASADAPPELKAKPVFERIPGAKFRFTGIMGQRIGANLKNWLLIAPQSNPAMLQIFRDRERTPRRDLIPWAGEFAGKYLISAVQAMRMVDSLELENQLHIFVADLINTQDADGYLGPFPKDARMVGAGLWDLWGQYHVMLGLYMYAEQTGDQSAMDAVLRAADYFCKYFLDGDKRVVNAGSEEMNESSIHIFTLLYEKTGNPRYWQLVQEIEKDFEVPPSGDYIRSALEGKKFYEFPKPRWESLHAIQAIAEMHFITGDEKYRKAYDSIWHSIQTGDVHNTGGFSSGEKATGNPYNPEPIETCCTIAWMAVSIDMLRMTGKAYVADALELATWNAVLGSQSPTGRWWTYNTPMDGERKAATQDIDFQSRAGSPELNCCSVNAPRGLGMLSEWAVMHSANGLVLNYYGPSQFEVTTPSGNKVRIEQVTDFPVSGQILIKIDPEKEEKFDLKLRLPNWTSRRKLSINGGDPAEFEKEIDLNDKDRLRQRYVSLDRLWKRGDRIQVEFALNSMMHNGKREAEGKFCIYHGPLLMAYDPRFDKYDPNQLPAINHNEMIMLDPAPEKNPPAPAIIALRYEAHEVVPITLVDFASAGAGGNLYRTWIPYEVDTSRASNP